MRPVRPNFFNPRASCVSYCFARAALADAARIFSPCLPRRGQAERAPPTTTARGTHGGEAGNAAVTSSVDFHKWTSCLPGHQATWRRLRRGLMSMGLSALDQFLKSTDLSGASLGRSAGGATPSRSTWSALISSGRTWPQRTHFPNPGSTPPTISTSCRRKAG